ncbi:MAG: cobalamin-binding protein [Nitrospiria bacterium]
MRIVSFLPSATEIVYALGLEDQLVGVTHECDYPPGAKKKPVAVRNALEMAGFNQSEIDQCVREAVHTGKSLYAVDEALLKTAEPDLILTQDLCQVCAPSGNEMARLLKHLPKPPEILWLTPACLDDIFENINAVGTATGKASEANALVDELRLRVRTTQDRVQKLHSRPRVFFMEWLSPPYCGGHWVGEMIALAGGSDPFAKHGADSVRIAWDEIAAYAPEMLILSPCGFNLSQVVDQAELLTHYSGWALLPAVKNGRVFAVDANSYFARPGPRVVDGIELLAHLFHPGHFKWRGPPTAFRVLDREMLESLTSLH